MNLKPYSTKSSPMGKVAAIILELSCLNKVVVIISTPLLQFFLPTRYNPSKNNNLNNTSRYLKFRIRYEFYVPYFFSSLWTKYKQKDKHKFLQNKLTTHNSKFGTTSRFVERRKKKKICGNIIYLPTFLFVLLLVILKLAFLFISLSSFNNKSDWTPCPSLKLLQQLWQRNKPLISKPTFCPLPSLSKLTTFFFFVKNHTKLS